MSKMAATQVGYHERVTPKWTNFLPLALVLPTFWLTLAPINASLGLFLGLSITILVAGLMIFKAPVISVRDSKIFAGKANIDLRHTGKLSIIPSDKAFAAKGPELDARAYLALQPSRKGLIKLEITDENDPTPYWLISTKKPELLKKAIEEARN
jgi:hypothetical protein